MQDRSRVRTVLHLRRLVRPRSPVNSFALAYCRAAAAGATRATPEVDASGAVEFTSDAWKNDDLWVTYAHGRSDHDGDDARGAPRHRAAAASAGPQARVLPSAVTAAGGDAGAAVPPSLLPLRSGSSLRAPAVVSLSLSGSAPAQPDAAKVVADVDTTMPRRVEELLPPSPPRVHSGRGAGAAAAGRDPLPYQSYAVHVSHPDVVLRLLCSPLLVSLHGCLWFVVTAAVVIVVLQGRCYERQ